ncbi:MAG: hypothetical protein HC845_12605, partial [Akkermansiaceae bacterium]|nr:hypothetical protein [Akkermansiaceae bacterium]
CKSRRPRFAPSASRCISHTPNEFLHAVAADYPRGWFPRYWCREQSYWTPIGSPKGKKRGLINEEGMVEVDEAGFSLEPFLLVAGQLVTWADAKIQISLADDGTPFPTVTWQWDEMKMHIVPWMDGTDDELTLRVNYVLENITLDDVRLVITARPFQVNPPWQAFRNLGGQSPIHKIECLKRKIKIDSREILTTPSPQHCGAAMFEEGGVLEFLSKGEVPMHQNVNDPSGLASAAMIWNVPKGKEFTTTLSFPYFKSPNKYSKRNRQKAIECWKETLAPVEWRVPPVAQEAIQCFHTAAAHILINRDGPAIQPGPRRYTRSWVRDCVIMGAALAKIGQAQALREFLNWYVQFQHPNGHVPCVVDRDGVDSLVEHDSHGQWIWGVSEIFRADQNLDFLKSMWPSVKRAADYLLDLRKQRLTDFYQQPKHAACYGLLPESASHEGYLAHPVHSYWDDFWGIRGLEAAAELAAVLGYSEDSTAWKNEANLFLADTISSIGKVIADRKLDYIPGSVEWADFDPTATANAIALLDFADDLPAAPLDHMLGTYLDGFRKNIAAKFHGSTTPPTKSVSSVHSFVSGKEMRPTSYLIFSYQIADLSSGINGRKSAGVMLAHPDI